MISDTILSDMIRSRDAQLQSAASGNPIVAATMHMFYLNSNMSRAMQYKAYIDSRESVQDLLAMVDISENEQDIRSMLLHLYSTKLDKSSNLIKSSVKSGYATFEIEINYYFVEALLKIASKYPTLSVFAEDMAKVVVSSIMTNFYYEKKYSDEGAGYHRPDFYYIIHRRNDNEEIEKLIDNQRLGLLIGMKVSSYYQPDDSPLLDSPYSRLRKYVDSRTYIKIENTRLIGEQSGLLTRAKVIRTEGVEDVEYIEKYPFNASIINNIRFNYSAELESLPAYPLSITALDERTAPIFEAHAALSLVELWRQRNAPSFPAFRMSYLGVDSLATRFPILPSQNIPNFSWESMPTRWKALEDKTTQDFHDALLYESQSIFDIVNNGLRLPDKAVSGDEKLINWFAFINGVNKNHILNFPLQARRNLGVKNKWVEKRRSTTNGFNILQVLLMDDFRPFKLNKPYQPFRTTVYRHTNGGIWAFEIQPAEYNNNQIPKIWKALSDSYTSARYLLIITALNALSDLGNHSQFIGPYVPSIEYTVNAIVRINNTLYRKLIKGTKESPISTRSPWRLLTDTIITVGADDYDPSKKYKRNALVIYKDKYYQLYADEIVGKRPDLPFTFWGVVEMNREYREGRINNVFYSGIACTNVTLPCTNSEAYHLSTAFRFPGTLQGDYSFRLHEKIHPRRDVMLGFLSEYLILNVPGLDQVNTMYEKNSGYTLTNENQTHWGNVLEDWISAHEYHTGRDK